MDWNSKQQLVNYRVELNFKSWTGRDVGDWFAWRISIFICTGGRWEHAWVSLVPEFFFLILGKADVCCLGTIRHCSMYTWGLFIGYWAWLSCIWPRITVFIHDDDGDGDIPLPARKQATLDGMESQIRSCLIKSKNSFLNFG